MTGFPELFAAGGTEPGHALFVNETAAPRRAAGLSAPTPRPCSRSPGSPAPIRSTSTATAGSISRCCGSAKTSCCKGGPDCTFAAFPTSGLTATIAGPPPSPPPGRRAGRCRRLLFGNYVDRDRPERPVRGLRRQPALPAPKTVPIPPDAARTRVLRAVGAVLRLGPHRPGRPQAVERPALLRARRAGAALGDGGRAPALHRGRGLAATSRSGAWASPAATSTATGCRRSSCRRWATSGCRLREAGGPIWRDVPFESGHHRPAPASRRRRAALDRLAASRSATSNNDGRDDVFIAKGNVEQMPSNAMEDPNNLLMQGPDGRVSRGRCRSRRRHRIARSRGAVLVDLNLDGRLDLAVVNRRVPMEVYENVDRRRRATGSQSHLRQPGPNTPRGRRLDRPADRRPGVVPRDHRRRRPCRGVALPEHFGLGAAETAELRVTWPDGTTSDWIAVEADCVVRITRTDSGVRLDKVAPGAD